ncbi:sensor histidine kinase [Planomonospora sp. ID82291]|uniref:sensor histidine kinase n=1 Tax=Planomonospora sp. ID82291 TaxID=2738136 RepID=UPI0018C3C3DE|nr:sensor histidine kinase [Planomonospora sp. ID82291]MBG0812848.1 hypothetical protein [Planomonospora sp. ID82291]
MTIPPRVRRDLPLWAVLCAPLLASPPFIAWWEASDGWARGVSAGAVILAVAVLARRRAPLAAALAVLAAGSLDLGYGVATARLSWIGETVRLGPLNGFTLAIAAFSFRVGRRTARARPAALAYSAILGTGALCALAVSCGPEPDPSVSGFWLPALSGVLFSAVLPWSAGLLLRQRAEAHDRERRLVAGQVRLRERNRIAQDMHDSIGHDLALIALRAAALEMAPDLDERHRRAAGELRAAAADTTERLRRVIGVLREEGEAPLAPAAESVAGIVDRARDSGMRVELRGDGGLRDRTACRIVQEALTNVAKHAPGAPVAVEAAAGPGGIELTVTNPAPGGATAPAARPSGGGLGLMGLRERVRLAGGTFEAAPHAGGFRIAARFPGEDAAAACPPEGSAGTDLHGTDLGEQSSREKSAREENRAR